MNVMADEDENENTSDGDGKPPDDQLWCLQECLIGGQGPESKHIVAYWFLCSREINLD
jgi:hypothetical protein